eukprot:6342312-Alexandrium_andersonii.AAC.1
MEGKGEPKTEEDLPGAAPMADVATEKNQRLIEADAREAALRTRFPMSRSPQRPSMVTDWCSAASFS